MITVDNRPTYDLKFTPFLVSDQFNYNLLSKLININEDSLQKTFFESKNL